MPPCLGRSKERIQHRDGWLRECLDHTQDCNLVFFDPDNGLETPSVRRAHPKSGKYIFWTELASFWNRGNTLVIYHHLNRTASVAQQVAVLRNRFTQFLDGAMAVPLVFRRGSSRVFWLVRHSDPIGEKLERRIFSLLNGDWAPHYRPFGWPGMS
jgi:hypothetical protein